MPAVSQERAEWKHAPLARAGEGDTCVTTGRSFAGARRSWEPRAHVGTGAPQRQSLWTEHRPLEPWTSASRRPPITFRSEPEIRALPSGRDPKARRSGAPLHGGRAPLRTSSSHSAATRVITTARGRAPPKRPSPGSTGTASRGGKAHAAPSREPYSRAQRVLGGDTKTVGARWRECAL